MRIKYFTLSLFIGTVTIDAVSGKLSKIYSLHLTNKMNWNAICLTRLLVLYSCHTNDNQIFHPFNHWNQISQNVLNSRPNILCVFIKRLVFHHQCYQYNILSILYTKKIYINLWWYKNVLHISLITLLVKVKIY